MKRWLIVGCYLISPFLTCDPQLGLSHYAITGLPWAAESEVKSFPKNTGELWLDLAQTPDNGNFPLQVRACNVWTCSEPSFFDLKRERPASVGTLSIKPGP